MAASKKKAQKGAAIPKSTSSKPTKVMSPSLREVPGTRKQYTDKQKDSVMKALSSKKMKNGGGPVKKPSIPYPKDYFMAPADSAAFRSGYGQMGDGDGYPGISQNPYFKKGQTAAKLAPKSKKTMKSGGKLKKK
jgi:hypothetical protein